MADANQRKCVTLRDVAKSADVSVMTASNVANGVRLIDDAERPADRHGLDLGILVQARKGVGAHLGR